MTTAFSGMNPFVEGQEWEDFHSTFNNVLREVLSPQIGPKYATRVERRIYVEEHFDEDDDHFIRADAAIVLTDAGGGLATLASPGASTAVEGIVCVEEEHRETYLVIRHVETQQVVTVIETLSPANKRRGSDGHREYLNKRNQILKSQCSLVEIDLLRGGSRLPMRTRLPSGDYYAIICPRWRRPKASIHAWGLRDPLPTIAIPLKKEDGFVEVNLQQVADTVYERADYDLTIDYSRPLHPPLDPNDQDWLKSLSLPSRHHQPHQSPPAG